MKWWEYIIVIFISIQPYHFSFYADKITLGIDYVQIKDIILQEGRAIPYWLNYILTEGLFSDASGSIFEVKSIPVALYIIALNFLKCTHYQEIFKTNGCHNI